MKKPIDPTNPPARPDLDEDDGMIQLQVGDLALRMKGSPEMAQKTIKTLIKDKSIGRYLGFYQKKRLILPSMFD